jgi:hypothetical protein
MKMRHNHKTCCGVDHILWTAISRRSSQRYIYHSGNAIGSQQGESGSMRKTVTKISFLNDDVPVVIACLEAR